MRAIIFIMLGLFALVGCSSSEVNELKVKASDKAYELTKDAAEKQFEGVVVEGHDCNAEAVKIAEKVRDKFDSVLKADRGEKKSALSIGKMACIYLASEILPKVLEDSSSDYACSRVVASGSASKLGAKLCEKIKD